VQSVKIVSTKDLFKVKQKLKGKLLKYLNAKNIGVLISTKPGQFYLNLAKKLKKENIYFFVDNTFDFKHLEDYNFIDAWVNTACPRIGQDDELPVINIKEALDPDKYLEILGK
jgi:diphthamide biosynthesis enzyme Dph1/Dph2-like protein